MNISKREVGILLVLVILSSVVLFTNLSKGSLSDWDEAYNGQRTVEMVETGEWFSVKTTGIVSFEKPLLFYWLTGINYKLFGISEFTTRFWPAFFGVGTILLVYLLGRDLTKSKLAGFVSALVLLSSHHFVHQASITKLDVPLTFFMVLSAWFFWKSRTNIKWLTPAAIAIGLGFWTKSFPAMLMLIVFVLFVLVTKEYKKYNLKNLKWPFITLTFFVLAWYIPQYLIHGSEFIKGHFGDLLSRVDGSPIFHIDGSSETHHYGSPFLLNVLITGFFPWILFIPLVWIKFFVKKKKEHIFLLIWSLVLLFVFFVSAVKLPWYVVPVYPVLALCVGFIFSKGSKKSGYLILSIILFLMFLQITPAQECNEEFKEVSRILEGLDYSVHDSVNQKVPGEWFYLGYIRNTTSEIKQSSIGVSHHSVYNENFKSKYSERVGEIVIFSNTHEIKKPVGVKSKQYLCYPYMPHVIAQTKTSLLAKLNPLKTKTI